MVGTGHSTLDNAHTRSGRPGFNRFENPEGGVIVAGSGRLAGATTHIDRIGGSCR
jgi:hypothetical protein